MARLTDEERLNNLNEKIEQMQERKKRLRQQINNRERKERTRRLIQVGGLIEKHFNIEGPEQAAKLIYFLQRTVKENKQDIFSLNIEMVKDELDISK